MPSTHGTLGQFEFMPGMHGHGASTAEMKMGETRPGTAGVLSESSDVQLPSGEGGGDWTTPGKLSFASMTCRLQQLVLGPGGWRIPHIHDAPEKRLLLGEGKREVFETVV